MKIADYPAYDTSDQALFRISYVNRGLVKNLEHRAGSSIRQGMKEAGD
jgi:hypothetical protein